MIKRTIVIFLCFPLFLLFAVDATPFERSFSGICTKVLDGDTIIVNNRIIRLKGIDAPEKAQRSYDGHKIGEWSKDYLTKLILNKRVEVRYRNRGRYNRYIGEIFIKDININKLMLKDGMSVYYSFIPNVELRALEFEARLLRKGIFGTFGFDRPSYFRKTKKKAAHMSGLYSK